MHLSTIYTKIDTQKSIILKHFKSLSEKIECVTKDGVTYLKNSEDDGIRANVNDYNSYLA